MPQDLPDQEHQYNTNVLSVLVRIYWFALGYFFTLYSVNRILSFKAQFFSSGDILYWLSIIIIIGIRFIDVKFFHGDTAEGIPATIKDFFIYSGMLIVISLVVWLGIHFIVSTKWI